MSDTPLPVLPQSEESAAALSGGDVRVYGVRGAALAKVLADMRRHLTRPLLVLAPEPEEAEDLAGDMALFGCAAKRFPAWDILPGETDRPDIETAAARVEALKLLVSADGTDAGTVPIVVTSMSAALQPVIPPDELRQGHVAVAAGQEYAPEALAARLLDAGLEAVAQVDGPGQFARRGGIMDIFPLLADKPVRLEWFGDEIDTVRHFDTTTQRSGVALDEEIILVDVGWDQFRKAMARETKSSLLDYLPADSAVLLLHPERLAYVAELYASGFDAARSPLLRFERIAELVAAHRLCIVPELQGEAWDEETWRPLATCAESDLHSETVERLEGGLDTALEEFRRLLAAGARVTVYCHNAAEQTRLREVLLEKGGGIGEKIETRLGHLSKGFLLHDSDMPSSWAVIGDHEIFGRITLRRTPRKRFQGAPIADFTDLRPGNYVVHIANGIARYEGIKTLESNGTQADYLTLRFAEEARIYVPLSHVELVQRYVGAGDARPKLSKLGGKAWSRKKRAAEAAAKDIAADLLRLQAVRKALPGIACPEDDELQLEFENAFPYEETPDQYAAISDIKADQETPHPMDRLLCGDVGFGKTEVAIRAAFKVVNAGKQVAILVPTTVLAEQHYRTFRERMADYPVLVACLSRFRTGAEQKRMVEAAKEGKVDILIGTHRLLSQDVAFRDLGLVVIDEEQRFGVEHKERLKEMRVSVDVLTMTATPIPRTLNMALLGLRDISNLATAPTERQAIRTLVVKHSDELIRRAILRELSRGGQCFFLHNRVQNIDAIAGKLAALVPEARFGIAHGQMPEKQLLGVMNRFLDKQIDVLVCTTIIESGVDIPSVNTLFVNEADHFGLSELHQLRGRVGRYRNQAYAYFLVPPKRPINPVAQKRLLALEEYSELGAGFRIAMRDLEIRGAGNILGVQQSGHILNIGFELYCRLLEKAVAQFRGDTIEEREPVELDLGTHSFIPTEYIDADKLRVEFYRKLAGAEDAAALENLRGYARDLYGEIPAPLEQLFADQALRNRASDTGVNFLGRTEGGLVVAFHPDRAKQGVQRLRTLRRHVTPMEGARWRVALRSEESETDALLAVADTVLTRLAVSSHDLKKLESKSMKESSGKKKAFTSGIVKPKAKLGRIEIGIKSDKTRHQRDMDRVSSDVVEEGPSDTAAKPDAGARVIGLEPNERLGLMNALVEEETFDTRRFGPVTLVMGEGKNIVRHWLRYTGTAHAPSGQISLSLRGESAEDIRQIVNDHLAGGYTVILPGVVEE